MEFSHYEYYQILEAIQDRAEVLKRSLEIQAEKSEECLHEEIINISTLGDIRKGHYVGQCSKCGQKFIKRIKED